MTDQTQADVDVMLERVCRAVDALISAGGPHHGLFPSILDRRTGRMLDTMPPPIEGQRNTDRAFPGSNLMHDEPTLSTMYALSTALDRPDYAQAADQYLHRFATHCTNTVTGLFPWGEHAYWHLTRDCIGNSYRLRGPGAPRIDPTHDQLRQAPLWLWQKLASIHPQCVSRFADGLKNHWNQHDPPRYIRHAYIEKWEPFMPQGEAWCDFPRHGGFYIFDLACAYMVEPREEHLDQIRRFMDYWWRLRREDCLCRLESWHGDPVRHRTTAVGQTLSLAVSLLESAQLLDAAHPKLAAEMRRRAETYIDGFFAAPHAPQRDLFLMLWDPESDPEPQGMAIWGSRYGQWPLNYVAMIVSRAYQLTGQARLLDWLAAAGRAYAGTPFPHRVAVPAMDAGLSLALCADLYEQTGEDAWLDTGRCLASELLDRYMDAEAPLPRGAAGIDWYESQMGPGFLLHGLARLALVIRDGAGCALEGDYTVR